MPVHRTAAPHERAVGAAEEAANTRAVADLEHLLRLWLGSQGRHAEGHSALQALVPGGAAQERQIGDRVTPNEARALEQRPPMPEGDKLYIQGATVPLTETERLSPLAATPSGDVVRIDRGVLAELYQRLAEYAGAVWRLNDRMAGVKLERRCSEVRLETGSMPVECPR